MAVAQGMLFDVVRGRLEGDHGKEKAASGHRAVTLKIARTVAVSLARKHPPHEVCADDVYLELIRMGVQVDDLGNAAGSLFSGAQWEFTGRRVRSVRVSNHAREIKVWRLR